MILTNIEIDKILKLATNNTLDTISKLQAIAILKNKTDLFIAINTIFKNLKIEEITEIEKIIRDLLIRKLDIREVDLILRKRSFK